MARILTRVQEWRTRRKNAVNAAERDAKVRSRVRWRKNLLKGLLLVFVLLLVVLPPLFVADPISYLPLLMVVLLLIISQVYVRVLASALSFDETSLLDSCERGSEVEFSIGLVNRSILPHSHLEVVFYISDLFGNYDSVMNVNVTLGPRERRTLSFGARFAHVGSYSAGVQKLVLHDLLGLFTVTLDNSKRHFVAVGPRYIDLAAIDLSDVNQLESRNTARPLISDDMDYAGVREYRWGDPLKTIHWNLSSRMPDEQMFTRQFEVYANPGLAIVIDPTAPDGFDAEQLMCLFDGLVESAAALHDYAHAAGIDSEILYINKNGEVASMRRVGPGAYQEMVRDMMRLSPESEDVSFAAESGRLLRAKALSNQGQGNIALCAARLDSFELATLVEARMRRRNPLLFVSLAPGLDGKERKKFLAPLAVLRTASVPYYLVISNEQATEVEGL